MKIRVNYDLIDKIKDSKTGFVLKRTSMSTLVATSVSIAIGSLIATTGNLWKDALLYFTLNSLYRFPVDYFVTSKLYKVIAIKDLSKLLLILRQHYINTDYELLKEAYQYETNYTFMFDEGKMPRLKQEKYIMVPVVDRDGEKEVSLVQEHVIGTNEYELSYGSPKKVLKPAVSLG